ncbi:HTH-type transcriptional repressor NicS [Calidithermus terrae]|uniref:HTH-type transcriptional repressor NicS n=1 Tax=Calidithermus terrae TaxID=1408545 RepID=A0A399DYB3_9DEIN|nr:TetR/AcrR family transcriptional regulator [Calidithermus terrae]RIH76886.1 HTH-type transcriptional repressor NicS [Calidithermus terrae]
MSSKLASAPKARDAGRSRSAILDAAEELFAEKGFDGVSFAEIGQRAGVSRGTPGYFFGSKAGLYRAVLERIFETALREIGLAAGRAARAGSPREVLAAGLGGYIDFIVGNPNFVRLVEHEALKGGGALGENPVHVRALEAGIAAIQAYLPPEAVASTDLKQLTISLMGLCWFPFAHRQTLFPALGIDPGDPEFLEARKKHVVELVLRGFFGKEA